MARTQGPGQLSFADVAVEGRRRKHESKRGRHLAMIDELVPWEDFRPVLETVWRKPKRERKSTAGRKPWDAVLMFKALVLGALYNLSDEALEHEDRRPADIHEIPGARASGPDAGRHDGVAVPGRGWRRRGSWSSSCSTGSTRFSGRGATRRRGARSWTLRSWRCRGRATARGRTRRSRPGKSRRGGPRVLLTGLRRWTWTPGGRRRAA